MNLLLLNPNTSADMSTHILREASRYCGPDITLVSATAGFGGAVIASRASYAIAAHAVLDTYARHGADADSVVIACFGDPGLEALRELVAIPVIGLLESAVIEAARLARPFGIITAGAAWVPMLEERITQGAHAALSCGVFAIDTTGLDITQDPDRFMGALQAAVDASTLAGADTVILGGSALAGFGPRLRTAARLIDPIEAAMAEAWRHQAVSPPRSPTPAVPVIAYRGLASELAGLLDPIHR